MAVATEIGVESRAVAASTVEQRCPICLEDFDNKTFIDACFHILLNVCSEVGEREGGERERMEEERKEGRGGTEISEREAKNYGSSIHECSGESNRRKLMREEKGRCIEGTHWS